MRVTDWQIRLADLVHRRHLQGFAWGERDCVTWAADAVLAVTGRDPLADLRGQWHSHEEARAAILRCGGLARACSARLGPRIKPALAAAGDVGLLRDVGTRAVVVHVGACWMGQGEQGLVPIRAELVRWAWRAA